MNIGHFNNITFQQMEALIHLAEEGSFSRAAQKMHITQPALTKSIRNIEESIDARVANRSSSGITLTEAGKILYDYARRLTRLRAEAAQKIDALTNATSPNIYLAASTIPATYILPHALSAFKKKHPGIKIYAKTADTEDAINAVLDKEAEIGLVGKKPHYTKLNIDVLWRDRLVLAVPRAHKWATQKTIMPAEIRQEPFVIRERGSATRYVLEEYLKKTNDIRIDDLNICCELGSSEAVKEALLAGLGVSVISRHAIRRELQAGTVHEVSIKGIKMERHFYLIYLRQTELSHAHKVFVEFLKNFRPDK